MVFGIGILQEIVISAVLIFATVMGFTCLQWSQSPYTQFDLLMNDINSLTEGGQKLVQFDFNMPKDYVILQVYGDEDCVDYLQFLNLSGTGTPVTPGECPSGYTEQGTTGCRMIPPSPSCTGDTHYAYVFDHSCPCFGECQPTYDYLICSSVCAPGQCRDTGCIGGAQFGWFGESSFVDQQEDLEDECEGKFCLCLYKIGFSGERYFESYPDLTTYQDVQDNRTNACTIPNKATVSAKSMYCKRIDVYQGPYPLYMADYDGYPLHWIYMGSEGWHFASTKFFWDTSSDYFRWFTIY